MPKETVYYFSYGTDRTISVLERRIMGPLGKSSLKASICAPFLFWKALGFKTLIPYGILPQGEKIKVNGVLYELTQSQFGRIVADHDKRYPNRWETRAFKVTIEEKHELGENEVTAQAFVLKNDAAVGVTTRELGQSG